MHKNIDRAKEETRTYIAESTTPDVRRIFFISLTLCHDSKSGIIVSIESISSDLGNVALSAYTMRWFHFQRVVNYDIYAEKETRLHRLSFSNFSNLSSLRH